MAITPKASFRLSAEALVAIADVQAVLSAKRGKPVSQAAAIDFAVRRAAEDFRAEPERRLSEADAQLVQEGAAKAGWPPAAVVEAWKDAGGTINVTLRQDSRRSQTIQLLRVAPIQVPAPEVSTPQRGRKVVRTSANRE